MQGQPVDKRAKPHALNHTLQEEMSSPYPVPEEGRRALYSFWLLHFNIHTVKNAEIIAQSA
jgi:hypothetical protein